MQRLYSVYAQKAQKTTGYDKKHCINIQKREADGNKHKGIYTELSKNKR